MEINVDEARKIVDIWPAKGETDNGRLQDALRNVYDTFGDYTVVVFHSGNRDPAEETSALLCCNRRRTAEQ